MKNKMENRKIEENYNGYSQQLQKPKKSTKVLKEKTI